jgi:hypothetical protein
VPDVLDGVLPSVVYRMKAPGVVVRMVTRGALSKLPSGGLKVGAETVLPSAPAVEVAEPSEEEMSGGLHPRKLARSTRHTRRMHGFPIRISFMRQYARRIRLL